jgi:serine/threonine protein kinase
MIVVAATCLQLAPIPYTVMPDQSQNPLQNGDVVLDRYRVERGIAQGGHSLVYRGLDERLSRPVCIKAFYKLANEKGIWETAYEHFVQEAFALSKLSHPNTLRIYDFGHLEQSNPGARSGENRIPVQISEYMSGGTLGSVVHNQGPLEILPGLQMIRKLGHALAEAHRLGIVHRDIKPQNILFTSEGRDREPKLADFGIAKSVTSGNFKYQAQETQVVVGFPLAMYSPSWAAPEQLDGAPASPPADVFSLALLAVYALSGKAICKGDTPDDAHERREQAASNASRALRDLDVGPSVVRIIQESCAYRADDRPQDAEEFASALEAAMRAPRISRRFATQTAETNIGPEMQPSKASAVPPPVPAAPTHNTAEPTGAKTRPAFRADPTTATELSPAQQPQRIDNHTFQFVEMQATTTLHWGDTRAQFTLTPTPGTPHNMTVNLKGVTTFVSKVDGRPTRAVHLNDDAFVDLLTPAKQLVGRLYVSLGVHSAGRTYFQAGQGQVSVSDAECPCAVLVDCPALNYSYILYGLGGAAASVAEQRQT